MKQNTKLTYKELQENLQGFYGTEHYYKVGLTPIVITDGVKYFADTCECYWLLDILCYNLFKKHQELGALFIDIEVNKRGTCHITVREDKDMPIIFEKKQRDICNIIPSGNYRIWLMNNVLLLPSEY